MGPSTEIDLTLGVLEIGILVATMMYGLSIVQAYTYSTSDSASHDPLWMKAMVVFLGLCETVHSILIWAYLYNLTVTHLSEPGHLAHLPWTFSASLALSGLIGATTQAFATYRVYRISSSLLLAVPAWALALLRAGLGVALTVVALRGGDLFQLRERYNVLVYVALGASVALDVWNCAALCWNLGRAGRQAKERGVMNAIMLWAVETGCATTAAAAVVLVCWVVWPGNGLWLCFFFIYSKLYSNSLLISLNSRERLRVTAAQSRANGQGGMTSFQAGGPGMDGGVTITRTFDVETASPPDLAIRVPGSVPRRYRSALPPSDDMSMSDVSSPWSPIGDEEKILPGKRETLGSVYYGVAV